LSDTVVFACCDSVYFNKFGRAFVNSACFNKHKVIVHIINPDEENGFLAFKLKELWKDLKFSTEQVKLPSNSEARRTVFASHRFHHVVKLMDENPKTNFMILDIDCIIRKHIPKIKAAVGLFFREPFGTDWEKRGTRVAAGAVYYEAGSNYFAKIVSEKIDLEQAAWFVDQVALAETADHFYLGMNIADLSKIPNLLDWEFVEDGIIWTGKGERKYNNEIYLKEFEAYNKGLLYP